MMMSFEYVYTPGTIESGLFDIRDVKKICREEKIKEDGILGDGVKFITLVFVLLNVELVNNIILACKCSDKRIYL